jgi:hypothetical protein
MYLKTLAEQVKALKSMRASVWWVSIVRNEDERRRRTKPKVKASDCQAGLTHLHGPRD